MNYVIVIATTVAVMLCGICVVRSWRDARYYLTVEGREDVADICNWLAWTWMMIGALCVALVVVRLGQ